MRGKGKILSEAEKHRLTELFEKTVDKVIAVFSGHAFRSYDRGWERQVNRALFDAVMLVFSKLPKDELVAQRKEIDKSLRQLCGNKDFFLAISRSTADRRSVFTRIKMFSEAMASIGLKSGIDETLHV